MSIKLARIDERLVHGQIITTWTKRLSIEKIYIIDDASAKDPFMRDVISLAAPSGLAFEICTVQDFLASNVMEEKKNIMLLFKTVHTPAELVRLGFDLKELNVGNIGSGPNRRRISKNVSLSEQEIKDMNDMVDAGVYVYLQMVVSDPKVNLSTIL